MKKHLKINNFLKNNTKFFDIYTSINELQINSTKIISFLNLNIL